MEIIKFLRKFIEENDEFINCQSYQTRFVAYFRVPFIISLLFGFASFFLPKTVFSMLAKSMTEFIAPTTVIIFFPFAFLCLGIFLLIENNNFFTKLLFLKNPLKIIGINASQIVFDLSSIASGILLGIIPPLIFAGELVLVLVFSSQTLPSFLIIIYSIYCLIQITFYDYYPGIVNWFFEYTSIKYRKTMTVLLGLCVGLIIFSFEYYDYFRQ